MKEYHRGRRESGREVTTQYEFRFIDRKGDVKYILLNVDIVPGTKKSVASLIDITERRQAEQALRASEQNFRSSLDNSPLGVRIVTAEGETLYANQALLDIYGYNSIQEMKAKPVIQHYTPESYAEFLERQEKRLRGKPTSPYYDVSIIRGNGELRHLSVSRKEILWDGKPQFQAITRDITDIKQAEQALRESEEFRSSLLDNAPNPITVLNPDTSIKHVNPALEKLTGFTSAELIGVKAPYPWWIADKRSGDTNELVRNMPEEIRGLEKLFRKKSGETFWAEVTSMPVIRNGELHYKISSWVDITERKQAEEKIREAETLKEIEHMRTELLANVSHELRTPLASIKGYASLLLDYDRRLKRDEKRQYLEVINRATERLVELVDQLLDMSRLEAGMLTIEKEPTSIRKLLNETVAEARVRSPWHQFVLKLPKRLPRVEIDPKRIRQVVDNLLGNAVKYSEEGSRVVVSVRRTGQELRVSVADQGVGIPADELPRVFDRMYHIALKLKPGAGGVGLGLSICKALVEAHGGRIWIKSRVGKGTECYFTLPRYTRAGDSNDEKE